MLQFSWCIPANEFLKTLIAKISEQKVVGKVIGKDKAIGEVRFEL